MARHLTYANVMATIAVFVALSGGAYAVTTLPRNSVTTIQVKNGSLLAKDFKRGQFAAGLKGADGLQGLKGPQGLQGPGGAQGDRGLGGPAGPPGLTGIQGIQGIQGQDGSAKAYAYISGQGTVGPTAHGITGANVTA